MTVAQDTLAADPSERFDLEGPSPLPALDAEPHAANDLVASAERAATELETESAPPEARAAAQLALADAWLALHALAPALAAVRQAAAFSPADPAVLARLGSLLARTGAHREAGETFAALASITAEPGAWLAAGRAFARAEATPALDALLAGLAERFRNDGAVERFAVEAARARAPADGSLVPRLLAASARAVRRGDPGFAAQCAVDAWVESRGSAGAALAAEAVAARAPEPAFALAIDGAARALAEGAFTEAAAALQAAGRVARALDAPALEAAVLAIASLLVPDAALREAAHDALGDAGMTVELAARLRADARRASDPAQGAAAWKGVAEVERETAPSRAAAALGEALVCDPTDAEAREALVALAVDPRAARAAREALCWAARAELDRPAARRTLLVVAGDLEAAAGDAGAALAAFRRAWPGDDPAARARVAAAERAATPQIERAAAALRALDEAPRERRAAALDALFIAAAQTPGALDDLALTTRVLAPLASADARAAELWLAVVRRRGDSAALLAALRRLATRATERDARAQAAVELAELLDATPAGCDEAAEVLLQLHDEQPDLPEGAAALAALAAHVRSPALVRGALDAAAASAPAATRSALTRLAGAPAEPGTSFAAMAAAFDDARPTAERAAVLREMLAWAGEAPALLARRTRALLALPGEAAAGLECAQRFARVAPLSPEATIAWFGAAGLAGEPEQVADAAIAVAHSLAAGRDAASVARAALARLFALGEVALEMRVAREATLALGLADRALRGAVLECAQRQSDPRAALELLEAAVAGAADSPGEQLAAVRRVAQLHAAHGDAAAEAHALRRLLAQAPADRDGLARLAELAEATGDRRALARALSLQLASEGDGAARRRALLSLAALQSAGGDRDAAVGTLERYAEERGELAGYAEAARALRALVTPSELRGRVARWAERARDPRAAAELYLGAARLAASDPREALALLRAGLRREPEAPALLIFAEQLAAEARAVPEMLALFEDLDAAAAGAHGRAALAYRRAAFLEAAGEPMEALAAYLALFERAPTTGALVSAIERLATAAHKYDVLVGAYRKLAEAALTADARVRWYLEAARVARDKQHDRRAAVDLGLLAHDVRRDDASARQVIELARSVKPLDPHAFRAAVETVVDRTLAIAAEVWDDDQKRTLAARCVEIAASELADATRVARAAELYLAGSADPSAALGELRALVASAPALVRDAVARAASARDAAPPQPPARASSRPPPRVNSSAREAVAALLAAGDAHGALAHARAALRTQDDDDALRTQAEALARDTGDADAELELLDARLGRTLDGALRDTLTLRAAELLRGPLARPEEARRRLEAAVPGSGEASEALVRALHEVSEQLGAWDAVATLLARRIARAADRAETRALRLHRAAVLEQRLDDPAGARAELEAVLEDEPAHRAALRYLADLYARARQFRSAGECFARAAATTPVRAEAAELLAMAGECFARGGDDVAADEQFRRALDLERRATRALRGQVELARSRGDDLGLERALAALADATEDDHERAELRLAAARAALAGGALFRARGHVDAARRSAPVEAVAELDAALRRAREVDRPARPDPRAELPGEPAPPLRASAPPPAPPPAAQSEPPEPVRRATPRDFLAVSRAVPQAIAPSSASMPAVAVEEPATAIPLVAPRTPRPDGPPPRPLTPTPFARVTPSIGGVVTVVAASSVPPPREPSEESLRAAAGTGDDDAVRALARRLARSESGRAEALKLERQRFAAEPTRLDALEALVGLSAALGRVDEARGLRTVLDVLSGREPSALPPPLLNIPEPPPNVAARMLLPDASAFIAEIGAMLWEALGNSYRRELVGYGVSGADRVAPTAPTDIARALAGAARVLELPRTQLFVRAEVPGGALVARTQPPAVVLAGSLTGDGAVPRYVLGHALGGTHPGLLLACTLDADERETLVRAVTMAFGAAGVLAGAPPAVARRANELFTALAPRAQRRVQELLATLDERGAPFSDATWMLAADTARARAGLLAAGDFGVAARMVVGRATSAGGEPDVPGALAALEPLRELARFATSERYLVLRWQSAAPRARRRTSEP